MSHLVEIETNYTNPFSDGLIIWIYNENIYRNINFPGVIYLSILAVLGILGNSLVIYIYGFRFKKTTANFFIFYLAVFDGVCCCTMIMEVFDKRFPMYSGNYSIVCKITRFIEMFSSVSSTMILLGIALDRYYKVCKPLKSYTKRKARQGLAICLVVSAALSWPMILFHGPEKVETGMKNVVGNDCGDDDNFKDSSLPTIYFGFMGILNTVVIVLLALMYVCIFRAILRWKREIIGESVRSTRMSVVSSNYKLCRMTSWINKRQNKFSKEHYKGRAKRKNSSSFKSETSDSSNTEINTSPNGVMTDMERAQKITDMSIISQVSDYEKSSELNANFRSNGVNDTSSESEAINNINVSDKRISVLSVSSGRTFNKRLKKSKIVTTNTILFSVITFIYIISYLPTITIETLNASGAYIKENLSDSTRSSLVLANVTYFINNVCNPYVYSAINPNFRKQVKKIFTGP